MKVCIVCHAGTMEEATSMIQEVANIEKIVGCECDVTVSVKKEKTEAE